MDQVEQLKKMALRSVTDRHKVQELTEENTRQRSQVPSMKKRLEEAQRQQRLEQENRRPFKTQIVQDRAAGTNVISDAAILQSAEVIEYDEYADNHAYNLSLIHI